MDSAEQANIVTDPIDEAKCPKCGAALEVGGIPAFTEIECPTCQATFPVPAKFGNFLLLKCLGQGGMGGVYQAMDTGLNREVGIKVMLKSLGDDPQFVENFQREAQAAAKLNNPNIAQIYAFGKENGQPYIAMELLTGGSLDKMMAKDGPLEPGIVMRIGEQIARGLSDAADAGLVHGDVKPENILFDNDHNAKLVDFGLAAMMSPENEIWGTPYYISPEKVLRQKTDFRADIYSLGGTLYHAICGVPPFDGPDSSAVVKARFETPLKPMSEIRKGISPELDAIIARMLETDPAKRYPTYRSLLNDIEKYLKSIGPVSMKAKKKIVIKGSKAASAATAAPSASDTQLPEGMTPITDLETGTELTPIANLEEEDNRADKYRGCKLFALIGLGLLLLVGLGIGGWFWYDAAQEKGKEKQEQRALVDSIEKYRAAIQDHVQKANLSLDKVKKYPEEALKIADGIAAEVGEVLNESAREQLKKVEVPELPLPPEFSDQPQQGQQAAAAPQNAETNAPAAGTNAVADVGALTNKLAEIQKKVLDGFAKAKMKPEDMAKIMMQAQLGQLKELPPALAAVTNEAIALLKDVPVDELLKLPEAAAIPEPVKQLLKKQLEAAGVAAAPAAEETPAEEAQPEQQQEEEPNDGATIVASVQGVYEEVYQIQAAYSLAERMVAKIKETAQEAEKYKEDNQTTHDALKKIMDRISKMYQMFVTDTHITKMGSAVSRIRKAPDTVRTEISSLLEMRRQAKLAAEKKAKEEAEAAQRQKEAEELKAKTDAEVQKVLAGEQIILENLKDLEFKKALRNLDEIKEELETDGGKDALTNAKLRVRGLEAFHDHMVTNVVGYKSARGWSISASDKRQITLNGKNKLLWQEIYNNRTEIFVELLRSKVDNDDEMKSLLLSQRRKLLQNAALALMVFCQGGPYAASAKKEAKRLVDKAIEKMDVPEEDVKLLIPALYEEAAPLAPAASDTNEKEEKEEKEDK